MRLCWEVQYNLLKHFIKGCTYNVHCCVFEYSQHLQYLQCLQSQHRTECFNCGARVLFCTGLSPTQFINTSNPLTHHRSLQTATDLKKVQNIPEDFYPVGLWASSYYFSCVQQSRGELSNLNGNEKHETGRKVIGATFYVPIRIFTATKWKIVIPMHNLSQFRLITCLASVLL